MQLVGFSEYIRQQMPSKQFQTLLRAMVLIVFGGAFGLLVLLTVSGTIAPWTGRFYSLWDTGYAKVHIPIIASVSEHQPTAWPAFFFDLRWTEITPLGRTPAILRCAAPSMGWLVRLPLGGTRRISKKARMQQRRHLDPRRTGNRAYQDG